MDHLYIMGLVSERRFTQDFKVVPELSGKPGIIDCFMAEMSFEKGRMQIYELCKSNKQDAEELMKVWKTQHPDILNLLQDRYRKIKEIGELSLEDKGRGRAAWLQAV